MGIAPCLLILIVLSLFDWKLALACDGVFTYVVLTPTPRMFLIRHFGDYDRPICMEMTGQRKMTVCKESTKRSGFPESQQNRGTYLKFMQGGQKRRFSAQLRCSSKSQQSFGDLLDLKYMPNICSEEARKKVARANKK